MNTHPGGVIFLAKGSAQSHLVWLVGGNMGRASNVLRSKTTLTLNLPCP